MKTRTWLNLALGFSSLVAALLLAEVVVRLDAYQPQITIPPFLYLNHPQNGWTLRPGFQITLLQKEGPVTYTVNRQGLRSHREIPASTNLRYLYVLGDGYAFGWGVNDEVTFPRVLGRRLKADNLPMEVVNLGVPEYGTRQAMDHLEEYSERLGAPMVVLYLFNPNDPVDNLMPPHKVVWGVLVKDEGRIKHLKAALGHVYHNSLLGALVMDQVYNRFFNPRLETERELLRDAGPLAERRDWAVTRTALEGMIQWCQGKGAHLVVATVAESPYTPLLQALLAPHEVPLVPLEEQFRLAGRTRSEVELPTGGYWNPLGHHVVTESIHRLLEEKGWLPPPKSPG